MNLQRGTSATSGKGLAICDGPSVVATVMGEGYPIGIGNGPRSEALATLFVAAPDLLAASRAFIWELDRGSDWPAWERAKDNLRAAIVKAEG